MSQAHHIQMWFIIYYQYMTLFIKKKNTLNQQLIHNAALILRLTPEVSMDFTNLDTNINISTGVH